SMREEDDACVGWTYAGQSGSVADSTVPRARNYLGTPFVRGVCAAPERDRECRGRDPQLGKDQRRIPTLTVPPADHDPMADTATEVGRLPPEVPASSGESRGSSRNVNSAGTAFSTSSSWRLHAPPSPAHRTPPPSR